MSRRQNQSYVNTLVFSIIAGLVSIALLVALIMSPAVGDYAYIVVTVEIGLVLIIVHALYRILSYESSMRRAASLTSKRQIIADTCPDYFTTGYDMNGSISCTNLFRGTDNTGKQFLMAYVPSSAYYKDSMGNIVFTGNSADRVIKLSDFEGKTFDEGCKVVQGRGVDADNKDSQPQVANNFTIPWSDLRPKCDAIGY